LTVRYTGFVNGDTAASLTTSPAISTTATLASAVGTYPITASGAVGANYTMSYVNGTLTVTQSALTITAMNQTKAQGAANPPLTVSYSGFVNGDTAASLTTPPSVTTTATTTSPAGTYPITGSGAASANYNISYLNGTLTITSGTGPVANDNSYSTTKATALIVATPGVLGNDTGGTLTAVLNTAPGHGTLILNANGSFRYTPSATYTGTDTFRYQAKDSSGTLSNIATVTITISQFSAAVIAPAPITPANRSAEGALVLASDRSSTMLPFVGGVRPNEIDVDGGDTRSADTLEIASRIDPFRHQPTNVASLSNVATMTFNTSVHQRLSGVDQ
jgi:VCBS repeat-containing protein